MGESENTFPMDITDPSSGPWNLRPEGYLVVILAGPEEAERAAAALVERGFAPPDIKLYTGKQILDNHDEYIGAKGSRPKWWAPWPTTWRVGTLPGYVREDRCALWLRLPDEAEVPKALRVLADHRYLHTRYHGSQQQTDFHVS
jgi:hypothetical protein